MSSFSYTYPSTKACLTLNILLCSHKLIPHLSHSCSTLRHGVLRVSYASCQMLQTIKCAHHGTVAVQQMRNEVLMDSTVQR